MIKTLISLLLFSSLTSSGQNFTIVKKKFHKNKFSSTIESWDKNRRNGQFLCLNTKGDTLAIFLLRRYAGHANVYVTYHRNGQVHKLEYSSAPDAGIQFYHETIYYDEKGIETQRFNQSHDDRVTTNSKF